MICCGRYYLAHLSLGKESLEEYSGGMGESVPLVELASTESGCMLGAGEAGYHVLTFHYRIYFGHGHLLK